MSRWKRLTPTAYGLANTEPDPDIIKQEENEAWSHDEARNKEFLDAFSAVATYLVREEGFENDFEYKKYGEVVTHTLEDLLVFSGPIYYIKCLSRKLSYVGELFLQKKRSAFRTHVNLHQFAKIKDLEVIDPFTHLLPIFNKNDLYVKFAHPTGVAWIDEIYCWIEKPFSLEAVKDFIQRLKQISNEMPTQV